MTLVQATGMLERLRAACRQEGHGDPRYCPMRDAFDEADPGDKCAICAALGE